MSAFGKFGRRSFLKGAAGLGAAGFLAACAPGGAPAAPAASSGGSAVKYADKAALFRYMTGGFAAPGPEDNLVKQLQEEILRSEYGINVDIQYESATWADIDALMEVRLQTQGVDGLQRHHRAVLRWIGTPGLIRDIDDVVKEYGKNLIPAFPEVGWRFFMGDGDKYMSIPAMRITPHDIDYVHIRRDWLDRIDRDIPTTLEELEEVLELFKSNNLGGDVTIPLSLENPLWMASAVFAGQWAPEPAEQLKMIEAGENIEPQYGSAMREGRFDYLSRLYGKGLINPEYTTWSYQQVYDAATTGIIGCLMGGHGLTNGTLQQQVEVADPTQDWVQVFPPLALKDVPNSGRVQAAGAIERGIVVCSWAQAPEAIVALADWDNKSFDNYITSRYGIEGKHWKWGDGGWIEDLRTPAPNAEYSGMRSTTWTTEWSNKAAFLPRQPGKEPKDVNYITRVRKTLHTRKEAHVPEPGEYPTVTQVDHWCPYLFTESATAEAELDAITQEYVTKIVKGEVAVQAGLAEYWDRWFAAGGETRMKEIQEQQSAWLAANPVWVENLEAAFSPDSWNTERVYVEPKQQA
jgi:ABC-type glycerol-3-phosphate transport system substrate-binding protein